MKKILKNNIKQYRENSNMSQTLLADKLGVSRPYLSIVENHMTNPGPKLMIKICEEFNCELGDMFTVPK